MAVATCSETTFEDKDLHDKKMSPERDQLMKEQKSKLKHRALWHQQQSSSSNLDL